MNEIRCANSCGGRAECVRVDCCHNCALYVRAGCTNDGNYAFVPRYFGRLMDA